ncbi:OATP domain containing protein [Trichuris trichiura]|uniref:OATP domain containing protein n=1 Tax=Trichuris trichiura TaxID=36087 RepID=A0A077Z4W3_TRITR|nr:OATP domain containing protein [Trichuris trichiura]
MQCSLAHRAHCEASNRLIVSISDIGYVLVVVFISYTGCRSNQARWIGSRFLLISISCLIIRLASLNSFLQTTFIQPHRNR